MKKKTRSQLRAIFRKITGRFRARQRSRYGYHVTPGQNVPAILHSGLHRSIPREGDTKAVYTWHKYKLAKQHQKAQNLYWSDPVGIRRLKQVSPHSDPFIGYGILKVKLPHRKTILRKRSKAELRKERHATKAWRGTGIDYQKMYYPEKEYVTTKRIPAKHIRVIDYPKILKARRAKFGALYVRRVRRS